MYILSSNITITDPTGAHYLEYIPLIEVKIKKSRKTLTNTAKITLPRNIRVLNGKINDIIQRGAKVVIQLGYDGNLVTRFTGYVSSVNAQIPLTIDCQDTMWTLKQNSFTHTWTKGTKVADIINYIYTGQSKVVDLTIGGLVAVKQSTAQILAGLKKFGLQCYFVNDVLIVDFAGVIHGTGNEVFYDFYQNIIENKLEYKLKDDTRIKVVGVSKLPNGKKYQIVAGDNDGEVHTLHYFNMTQDQMQVIVNAEINTLKYEGYKGSYTTFGLPEINEGDIAVLNDSRYPEHNGSYLTEGVEITFGAESGYRHEPVLERKLA
jgi:hypothetical protein